MSYVRSCKGSEVIFSFADTCKVDFFMVYDLFDVEIIQKINHQNMLPSSKKLHTLEMNITSSTNKVVHLFFKLILIF
ncbi:MAG: hypothetical protein ACTS73_07335 [Arsenophonus sp. NEOnobi-MAG3]